MNYKIFSFDILQSTQTFAHELIADGNATDKTIVVADAQSAGRGRYRRTWVSEPGNLYVSFIYKASKKRDPRLSYCVAIAVAEALGHFGIPAQIKWPNDVLVYDKKISGSLIEYSKNFVIIGIGINIKHAPTGLDYETAKTDDFTPGIERDELLDVLTDRLDFWRMRLSDNDFASVRIRWMELAAAIGTEIKYQGKMATLIEINADGALVLRRDGKYILVVGDEISI
ncbi:MAG: biotin--[acetyl-CoA-carboxylase] ligase [Alphaproteobacteria bacterium]|nr:biotin--[acetyl-CoA-carboxylase] ligase [Alphaproteobacteria bacterium]